MSFLAKIFGGGRARKQQGPSPQEAIQRLRTMEEMLLKKSEHLEKKIDQELKVAKSSKNKHGALSALERVEKLEKELAYIDEKLSNIEIQQQELEHANIETEYLKSVKYAASALKQAQCEQHEIANKIVTAVSNRAGVGGGVDQDIDEAKQ